MAGGKGCGSLGPSVRRDRVAQTSLYLVGRVGSISAPSLSPDQSAGHPPHGRIGREESPHRIRDFSGKRASIANHVELRGMVWAGGGGHLRLRLTQTISGKARAPPPTPPRTPTASAGTRVGGRGRVCDERLYPPARSTKHSSTPYTSRLMGGVTQIVSISGAPRRADQGKLGAPTLSDYRPYPITRAISIWEGSPLQGGRKSGAVRRSTTDLLFKRPTARPAPARKIRS